MRHLNFACLLVAAAAVSAANAQVRLAGTFTARKECPAFQSFRKHTNPGSVKTVKDQSYDLVGKNAQTADHYLIKVPGATPDQRWVAIDCGEVVSSAGGGETPAKPSSDGPANLPRYVLALSWEPAFCEGKPDKTECGAMTPDRFDASHFALHGLWPQPRSNAYCHVDNALIKKESEHDWAALPEPQLSLETKASLDKVMPGTMSLLERHEWLRHGTCYPGHDADAYFRDAVRLVDAINASAVRELLAANIGKTVETSDIAQKFDEAFGAGAGSRIKVACARDGGRRLIAEITLGLAGDLSSSASIPAAILASPATSPGCPSGVVDPAGLQ
jgi:ribonuclease T2